MIRHYYMVSVYKHNKKAPTTESELEKVDMYLHNNISSTDLIVLDEADEQHGKYNQLHSHKLFSLPLSFKYGKYTKYNEFKIHWQSVRPTDLEAVKKYIHKHDDLKAQFSNGIKW